MAASSGFKSQHCLCTFFWPQEYRAKLGVGGQFRNDSRLASSLLVPLRSPLLALAAAAVRSSRLPSRPSSTADRRAQVTRTHAHAHARTRVQHTHTCERASERDSDSSETQPNVACTQTSAPITRVQTAAHSHKARRWPTECCARIRSQLQQPICEPLRIAAGGPSALALGVELAGDFVPCFRVPIPRFPDSPTRRLARRFGLGGRANERTSRPEPRERAR